MDLLEELLGDEKVMEAQTEVKVEKREVVAEVGKKVEAEDIVEHQVVILVGNSVEERLVATVVNVVALRVEKSLEEIVVVGKDWKEL